MSACRSLSTRTGILSARTSSLFSDPSSATTRYSGCVCSRDCGMRSGAGNFPSISPSLTLLWHGSGVSNTQFRLFLGICHACNGHSNLCYFLSWIRRFFLSIRMLYDCSPTFFTFFTKDYRVISFPKREGPSNAFFILSWYYFSYSEINALCCWKAIGSGGATMGLCPLYS